MFEQRTLTTNDLKILKEKYPQTYEEQIKKVESGYPIQYLIGNVCFLNTLINVNENVLIPRFETEYLVEKVLGKIEKYKSTSLKVIDICTGSGCIAISIAKNTKFNCLGVDISLDALEVAKQNNIQNKTNVEFKELNILNEDLPNNFDIIIANPPYIANDEIVDVSTNYEPRIALYAEHNGLIFYEKILESIKNKPRLVAFEIGELQGELISKLAKSKFPESKISIEKDLCGKDRYIFIEYE